MPSHRKEYKQGRPLQMSSNGQEKNQLKEQAISEILVADTDSESSAKASDVEDEFEEEEEDQQ